MLVYGNVKIKISVGDSPSGVVADPNGLFLYVANRDDNTVMIIDLSDNMIINIINVGKAPFGITIDAERKELYSANVQSGDVSVIDLYQKKIYNKKIFKVSEKELRQHKEFLKSELKRNFY